MLELCYIISLNNIIKGKIHQDFYFNFFRQAGFEVVNIWRGNVCR